MGPLEAAMKLNSYEVECLHRLLGRVDIKVIPEQCFLIVVVLYERLRRALAREERVKT